MTPIQDAPPLALDFPEVHGHAAGQRLDAIRESVARQGYEFVAARDAWPLLRVGSGAQWNAFAESWNRLELDGHMADGGRYRLRRHATFSIATPGPSILREPHQPHYQDLAVVDDRRVLHGVTPIRTSAPDSPGHRDVLVVTFRRKAS